MAVTLTADSDPETASIYLTFAGSTADTVSIVRYPWEGQSQKVRGGQQVPIPVGDSLIIQDAEAPLDTLILWVASYYTGSTLTGTATVTGFVPSGGHDWIKSLTHPSISMAVTVVGMSAEETEGRNGVFDIIGRAKPLVVSDVRSSRQGTLTLYLERQVDQLRSILKDGSVVMFQTPSDRGYGDPLYMSVGKVTITRISPQASDQHRYVALEWIEVDSPVGTTTEYTAWSYDILLDGVEDYQAFMDAYPTYYEALTEPTIIEPLMGMMAPMGDSMVMSEDGSESEPPVDPATLMGNPFAATFGI